MQNRPASPQRRLHPGQIVRSVLTFAHLISAAAITKNDDVAIHCIIECSGPARLVKVLDKIHSKLGARSRRPSSRQRKVNAAAAAAAAAGDGAGNTPGSNAPAQPTGAEVLCETCKKRFPSRNALFKHLKQADILCGKPEGYDIDAARAAHAAAAAEKAAKAAKPKAAKTKRIERKAPLISDAAVALWFGDIPQELASHKKISEVLYNSMPRGMPMPYIKRVVKKGYRQGARVGAGNSAVATSDNTNNDAAALPPSSASASSSSAQPPSSLPTPATSATPERPDAPPGPAKERGAQAPWLGYAFVLFRDAAEAEQATAAFNGTDVGGGWTVRVMPGIERKGSTPRKHGVKLEASADPSLGHQLFPTTLRSNEHSDAIVRHCKAAGIAYTNEDDERSLVQEIKAHYRHHPRTVLPAKGVPVAPALLDPLLAELQRTRWPAVDHRAGMECSHYLVLYLGRPNPGYTALEAAVANLLQWADPEYPCTMVAVTKNFEGSPHIDARDVMYQYAVSLGSFTEGGQLCVESAADPSSVHVITTHNRIGRIDGRFIHWVRGHSGGDRYSVIYYSTNDAHATLPTFAFDPLFVPKGARKDE